jgi:hypothetical protein
MGDIVDKILPFEVLDLISKYDIFDYSMTATSNGQLELRLKGTVRDAPKRPHNETTTTMRIALKTAAQELQEAALSLTTQVTTPDTPLPRRRSIEICPGWVWPATQLYNQYEMYFVVEATNPRNWWSVSSDGFMDVIIETNHAMPNDVYKSIKRLKQATRWCYDRIESRIKAAENLLNDEGQAKAYDKMLRDRVLVEMAK